MEMVPTASATGVKEVISTRALPRAAGSPTPAPQLPSTGLIGALALAAAGASRRAGRRAHRVPRRAAGDFLKKLLKRGDAQAEENSAGDAVEAPPSMAQTYMRGPLTPTGSGKPLSAEELAACREELEAIKKEFGLREPERSHMDEEGTKWRFGGVPDYSLTNLKYLQGKTQNHPEGSLELIVENLVKTWEMERSHKVDPNQHRSVDPEKFHVGANGWKKYNNQEANAVGNYNVLLSGCPAQLYDSQNITWEESHEKFHDAFAAFPWELLEVFSGPPQGTCSKYTLGFTGTYEGNQGKGELLEMFGFGVATVDDQLRLVDVEIFYKPETFLEVLRGERPAEELSKGRDLLGANAAGTCPHLKTLKEK